MIRIVSLSSLLATSIAGLLAVDDIPGWTDLTAVAKVSVIAFLCGLMGVVMLLLLKTLRDQQREFISEVQTARKDYGRVITEVRKTDDDRYNIMHADMRDAISAVSGLSIQCAQAQATAASLHGHERREDQAQHVAERVEDREILHRYQS